MKDKNSFKTREPLLPKNSTKNRESVTGHAPKLYFYFIHTFCFREYIPCQNLFSFR